MSLSQLLAQHQPILAEGSVYELLRRSDHVQFDPYLAHAGLVFDPEAAQVLRSVHRAYCEIARQHQLPILTFTDTWRANPERIARAGLTDQAVNRANAQFLCSIREECPSDQPGVLVAGLTGCRGDAYRPQESMSSDAAAEFHRQQVCELADAGVDLLFAATLPALSEAAGIARVMSQTQLPYVISFVITPQGTLLDGATIDRAVASIDLAAERPPLAYFLNCVHPSTVLRALETDHASTLQSRFVGFQGNTSALRPEELDGLDQLQTEPPGPFARQVIRVGERCRMSVLGGCCGTDTSHIECIARYIAK